MESMSICSTPKWNSPATVSSSVKKMSCTQTCPIKETDKTYWISWHVTCSLQYYDVKKNKVGEVINIWKEYCEEMTFNEDDKMINMVQTREVQDLKVFECKSLDESDLKTKVSTEFKCRADYTVVNASQKTSCEGQLTPLSRKFKATIHNYIEEVEVAFFNLSLKQSLGVTPNRTTDTETRILFNPDYVRVFSFVEEKKV